MIAFETEKIVLTTGDTVVGRTCYVPKNCLMFYGEGRKPLLQYGGDVYVAVAGETGYFVYGLYQQNEESQSGEENLQNLNFSKNKGSVMAALELDEIEVENEDEEIKDGDVEMIQITKISLWKHLLCHTAFSWGQLQMFQARLKIQN